MAQPLSDARKLAVLAALDQVVKDADESVNKAASLLGLRQQTLHRALSLRAPGVMVADHVANYYGTTLDGLVRHFNKSEGPVRAGDMIGWRTAVDEARKRYPLKLDDWAWHRAADVVLPMAPDLATAEIAFELARFLATFCEVSHVGTASNARSVSR